MTARATRIDSQGGVVVPADVLAAAGLAAGAELIPHAEGPGRIVFETRAAMQARVRAKFRQRTDVQVSVPEAWSEYHAEETAADDQQA